MLPESSISPVSTLPSYEALTAEDPTLLKSTVVLKLNGGLGTGMGLEKAKSLLPLKGKDTFEFVQNKAPKVTADDLAPSSWPKSPAHEWCPPGHGDLYPAMLGSGTLDKLLARASSTCSSPTRTTSARRWTSSCSRGSRAAARRSRWRRARAHRRRQEGRPPRQAAEAGGLLLRESAQCPDEDEKEFQNVGKYKFFNTNNLWVNLAALKATMDANGGVLPLPVIKNGKTVDPRDKASTKVLQLETAMGAAIASFPGAGAILIPRSRFAPVKTTNDMLALMSDAYEITPDFRMVLKAGARGRAAQRQARRRVQRTVPLCGAAARRGKVRRAP